MSEQRRGLLLAASAYALWGLFPLYWPLVEPAGALEILAHRICWSAITMLALTMLFRRTPQLRAIVADRRTAALLVCAALAVTCNWGLFIYGVNSGHVVDVSLGYYINPLLTVLLGVLVLGERLRPWQWGALALAGTAVAVLTVDYGHPPWVAVGLASSFALYGLAKKQADVGAVESLTFETLVIAPFALAYLIWLGSAGQSTFGTEGAGHVLLLVSTGLVTAAPLLCFGAAATRVSLTTMGLLQYGTPTMHLVLGLVVFGEQMSPVRLAGFALVWAALAVFTTEMLRHRRQQLRLLEQAPAI